ncbi:MAG: hypothetical protein PHS23_00495 [Candidatus Cloacimonetes bacterium]|nr:hypothetical protein [Candidatus Cloacimonadota bacterium]
MQDTIFKIKQIASLVIFIFVMSLMGMITGRPVMMLAYAGFFLLMGVVVFLTLRNRQRHFEVVQTKNKTFRMILAAILMILAIISPMLIALRSSVINLPADMTVPTVVMLMLGIAILFIALVLITVFMINRPNSTVMHRVIGYVVFIIAAIIPGLLMSRVDSTPMGIGSVYYVAMAVLILAYNAMGLYKNQE